MGRSNHRQVEALLAGTIDSNLITGIGVAHHPGARIISQYSAQTGAGVGAAVYDSLGRGAVFTGTAVLMVILVGAARWRWNAAPPAGLPASHPKPLPADQ